MSEKIDNKELQFLLSRTRNTLSEAIFVMEREGAKMLDIKWNWVKAHSTDKFNNEVDLIAREASNN